ncbi:hypothetical protein [Planctomicrobium piriforme]|uniref:Uncharacterized protein n=1 Tax=Planctomicrobium piriforme TaxID=1576369 RepID=A0A1I3R7M0_9PLAN|nr:hypothetical protein [Planctomicrobium piriforme]SFJ41659.1 hypothetical protein SAMN05421753_12014 [Planctomicrobium piriforme]
MPVTLTIRDETTAGGVYSETPLEFSSERITVRELIRERVYQEAQDFNRQEDQRIFRGLVQPTDAERVLNGQRPEYRLKSRRTIDWKPQFEKAVEAFSHNGFFILIDHHQAESLDQVLVVNPRTQVSFVKLTMLVGG